MTQKQFWSELAKFKGQFRVTVRKRIRHKDSGRCPLEAVFHTRNLFLAIEELPCGFSVIASADSTDYHSDFSPIVRRKLLKTLGLKERV